MGWVVLGFEIAAQLHLTARVGRGHSLRSCGPDLVRLLIAEFARRLGLEHRVHTGRAATQAHVVGLDGLVSGRGENCPWLGNHPLGVAEVARILDGDLTPRGVESRQMSRLDGPRQR